MKGPALQYDIRALRSFVCNQCGRTSALPGRVTSALCHCSSPPRWMQPLDRPPVIKPDVSAFISPPDPLDHVVDENESDEVIPGWKPPVVIRPQQHPERRRLSEDLPNSELPTSTDPHTATQAETTPDSPPQRHRPERHERPQRESDRPYRDGDRRPPRGRSDRPPQNRQPHRRPATTTRNTPPTDGDDFGSGLDAAPAAETDPFAPNPNPSAPASLPTPASALAEPDNPARTDPHHHRAAEDPLDPRRDPRRRGRRNGRPDDHSPRNNN